MIPKNLLDISPEVATALDAGMAVVALESTIISHGMPWPDNLACAQKLEAIARENGAVPATIAIHDGRVKIGLSDAELSSLAKTGQAVRKVSRRDFASVIAGRGWGATTVAGTMIAAHAAGIKIFATGGIGGVHRGAELDFDVSADLTELGKTPVVVVCAGAKSILDLPKTLEVLETQGVPIWGWHCDHFPSFFTRSSGLPLEDRFDDLENLAAAVLAHDALGFGNGAIVVNPVPVGAALDDAIEAKWIDQALEAAKKNGISGKGATPYLLGKLVELSGGKTLAANLALVENNVALAAQLAVRASGYGE